MTFIAAAERTTRLRTTELRPTDLLACYWSASVIGGRGSHRVRHRPVEADFAAVVPASHSTDSPMHRKAQPQGLNLPARLNLRQSNEVCNTLLDMVVAAKPRVRRRHGVKLTVEVAATQVNWTAESAHGKASTAAELAKLLNQPLGQLEGVPCDEHPAAPAVGARIDVHWSEECKWYPGIITHKCMERGNVLHMVRYDLDRSLYWHDLSSETWRGLGAQPGPTIASVMLSDAISEILALREKRATQHREQRRAAFS